MAASAPPMATNQPLSNDVMDVTMSSPSLSSSTAPSSLAAYHQSLAQHIVAILRSGSYSSSAASSSMSEEPMSTSGSTSRTRSRSRSPIPSTSRRTTITALPEQLPGRHRSRANSLIDPNVFITVVPTPASTSGQTQDLNVDGESTAEGSSAISVMGTTTGAISAQAVRSIPEDEETRNSSRQRHEDRRGRARTRSGHRASFHVGTSMETQEAYEAKRAARLARQRAELECTVGSWLEGLRGASVDLGDLESHTEGFAEIGSNIPSPSIVQAAVQEGFSSCLSSNSLERGSLNGYYDPPTPISTLSALSRSQVQTTASEADNDRTPTALKVAARFAQTVPLLSPLISSTGYGTTTDTASSTSPYHYLAVSIDKSPPAGPSGVHTNMPLNQRVSAEDDHVDNSDDRTRSRALTVDDPKDKPPVKMSSLTFSAKVCKASFRTCKASRPIRSQIRSQVSESENEKEDSDQQHAVVSSDRSSRGSHAGEEKEWLLNVLDSEEWAASVVVPITIPQQDQGARSSNAALGQSQCHSWPKNMTRGKSPMRVVVTGEMPTPKALAVATFWG
ncbi:hypothetical protein IAU59_003375 [Kwoniella sp. CBS 9459]